MVVAGFMVLPFSVLSAEAQERDKRMVRDAADKLKLALNIPRRDVRGRLLRKAKAVAILPGTLSGGFVFGGKHGRGILISKDKSGKWAGPVREVTITEGKVGFMAGAKVTDLVLFFMTTKAVEEIKTGRVTLDGNAGVAAGPIGREGEMGMTLTSAVYSYTRTKGVFGGVPGNRRGVPLRGWRDPFAGRRDAVIAPVGQARCPGSGARDGPPDGRVAERRGCAPPARREQTACTGSRPLHEPDP